MEIVRVNLGEKSYKIIIGSNLLKQDDIFFPLKSGDQAMLITNKILANIWKDLVVSYFNNAKIRLDQVILSDGEQYKNLSSIELIISSLLKYTHNRDTTLVALGGGVIGDITGFSAAIYQRGVRYIQIPTSFLSQVDAAIGGKTAVNHILGKNMIGSFWQPSSVIIDTIFLQTLPKRELISGLAEVIKYAIIFDQEFFIWLENNVFHIIELNQSAINYCIYKCCLLKSKLVELDEKDTNLRAVLNLGHTYGHAIESYVGYGNWLHGEAVAVGLVMAARTSEKLGQFNVKETCRIIKLIKKIGLPIEGPKNMPFSAYFFHMQRDKKSISNKIRMILPIRIGEVKIYTGVEKDVISWVINNRCNYSE
ncbi:3-dehydroquinate synthase [Buchnera aphidicola (Formosaphis micheliae)]|uniref:3-dehydroquinate synthase n=1 Tax=Buchnera aphidicola TaxID=9 RepID=UPI0031B88A46